MTHRQPGAAIAWQAGVTAIIAIAMEDERGGDLQADEETDQGDSSRRAHRPGELPFSRKFQRTCEGQSRHPGRFAGGRHIAVRSLVDRGLLALAAQAARHNELFAQCVEAQVAEVDRGHGAGGVGLARRDAVDDEPVGARVMAEARQPEQPRRTKATRPEPPAVTCAAGPASSVPVMFLSSS